MESNFLNIPVSNVYTKPNIRSEVSTQILYGEKFKILTKKKVGLRSKLILIIILVILGNKNSEKILNLN